MTFAGAALVFRPRRTTNAELEQAIDSLNANSSPNAKYPNSAIGAFNFNDMTDMQGIMFAAMHTHQPCIMMASTGAVKYMGIHFVREMFQAARMTSDIPVYLMLDHSDSVETCSLCIDNGFSLVMYGDELRRGERAQYARGRTHSPRAGSAR